MHLLAFDTAGAGCSVACCVAAAPVAARSEAMAAGQAERLLPMIAATMREAGWGWTEVDLIATTIGPGSFTGIRVAVAAARGLSLATGKPCIGVSTMEAMAAVGAAGRPALCVVPGRQGGAFAQRFAAGGGPESAPMATRVELLAELRRDGDDLLDDPAVIDGRAVALAAWRRLQAGEIAGAGTGLGPLYLRDADARPDAGRPLVTAGRG